MSTGTTILLAVVIGAIIAAWCALSPDPLAETIRVRVFGLKTRAQRLLDSAKDRALKSKRDAEIKQARGNADLIAIKTVRRRLQNDLAEAMADVAKYNAAADNAASIQNADLVTKAEEKIAKAQGRVDTIQPEFNKIKTKEADVEAALTDLAKIIAVRARQVNEIDVRSRTARSVGDANKLISTLGVDGNDEQIKKAYDLVKDAEAEADVWTEQAEKVRAELKATAELESLAKSPEIPIEQRVAERMTKFQKQSDN